MYKLNSESRAAKYFEWVWGKKVTDYNNMCPYFWQYVLTIIFTPVILLGKGIYAILPAKKQLSQARDYIANSSIGQTVAQGAEVVVEQRKLWRIVGLILKYAFFIGVGLLCLLIVIAIVIAFFKEPVKGLAFIGGIFLALLALGGAGFVLVKKGWGKKILQPFKFMGNMARATYKEMCPLISWN